MVVMAGMPSNTRYYQQLCDPALRLCVQSRPPLKIIWIIEDLSIKEWFSVSLIDRDISRRLAKISSLELFFLELVFLILLAMR